MIGLILSILLNVFLVLIGVFVMAFFLMVLLNPTANPKEIFNYWIKTYNEKP